MVSRIVGTMEQGEVRGVLAKEGLRQGTGSGAKPSDGRRETRAVDVWMTRACARLRAVIAKDCES